MTKTNTIRAAMFIFALTLITSTFVARTFAKYVTEAGDEASAKVAYWGFNASESSIDLSDLFKSSYSNIYGNETVLSSSNVIAPGTSGSASFSFPYEGGKASPDVAYDFMISVDGSNIDTSILENSNIQWSLDGQEEEDFGSWNKMLTDIIRLSGDASYNYKSENPYSVKRYYPGSTPPELTTSQAHTIYWRWLYTDSIDNSLGNQLTPAEVKLKISISATQVD